MSEEKERYRILHYFDGLFIALVCLNQKAVERVRQLEKLNYYRGDVAYVEDGTKELTPK